MIPLFAQHWYLNAQRWSYQAFWYFTQEKKGSSPWRIPPFLSKHAGTYSGKEGFFKEKMATTPGSFCWYRLSATLQTQYIHPTILIDTSNPTHNHMIQHNTIWSNINIRWDTRSKGNGKKIGVCRVPAEGSYFQLAGLRLSKKYFRFVTKNILFFQLTFSKRNFQRGSRVPSSVSLRSSAWSS